jgi:hypothetical protein
MTLQELVDRLQSHPLYQAGKAAETDVALIMRGANGPYIDGSTIGSITSLRSKRTGEVRLGLRVVRVRR